MSNVQWAMCACTSKASCPTLESSISVKTLTCSFITSRKSSRILKWNVGVSIFLLACHFSPVLKGEPRQTTTWMPLPASVFAYPPPPHTHSESNYIILDQDSKRTCSLSRVRHNRDLKNQADLLDLPMGSA